MSENRPEVCDKLRHLRSRQRCQNLCGRELRNLVKTAPSTSIVRSALAALVIGIVLGTTAWLGAQSLSFTSGQNISPAFEGWEQAPDGAQYFLFGYMNRNWEEEIDVPVGPENGFNVGGADQGQPTHFLPRRNRFVFRVKVPERFHREGRADLDAHHARQDREGLRDAPARLPGRRCREGVRDRCARRRHQQPGSPRATSRRR